jgi:putative membrane protein insertion efficiency factor
MKKIAVKSIGVYQKYLSILLKMSLGTNHFCRYNPTCSDYAKSAIIQHGVLKGGLMATLRILSCQPVQLKTAKAKIKNYLIRTRSKA